MFSKDVNLDKLITQKNLDVTTVVRSKESDKEGKVLFFHVEATGILFDPEKSGQAGSMIKKITISAVGKDIEQAQDNALAKLQKLLGLEE